MAESASSLAWVSLAWLLATSCAPAEHEDQAHTTESIVNGQLDTGDPAVVALGVNGYFSCSGTLITPTVVMTAAHCVPPYTTNSFTDIVVFFGNDLNQGGTVIGVTDGWAHPSFTLDAYDYDIALMRMAEPGPTAPLAINTTEMNFNDVGDPVRIVGFGMTSENNPGSAGTKRQGSTTVAEVYDAVFTMPLDPSGTCSGDSGGTALIQRNNQEVVAGIHSRSDCMSTAIDTRVDAYLNDINGFIGPMEPGCGFDNQCAGGCTEPDPDCPCAGDGFCTSACGDPASDPDCDPACGPEGTCTMSCPMPDPDCAACNAADGVCTKGCAGDPDCPSCPADNRCDASCKDDPDCWTGGSLADTDIDGTLETGCAVAPPSQSPTWLWLLAAALSARKLSRRERRGSVGRQG